MVGVKKEERRGEKLFLSLLFHFTFYLVLVCNFSGRTLMGYMCVSVCVCRSMLPANATDLTLDEEAGTKKKSIVFITLERREKVLFISREPFLSDCAGEAVVAAAARNEVGLWGREREQQRRQESRKSPEKSIHETRSRGGERKREREMEWKSSEYLSILLTSPAVCVWSELQTGKKGKKKRRITLQSLSMSWVLLCATFWSGDDTSVLLISASPSSLSEIEQKKEIK